jgi:hypothetical protein
LLYHQYNWYNESQINLHPNKHHGAPNDNVRCDLRNEQLVQQEQRNVLVGH